jgi:ATP-dependent RNA helicase DDX52/ROK1
LGALLKRHIKIVIGERNAAALTIQQRLLFVTNESGKLHAIRQIAKTELRPPVHVGVDTLTAQGLGIRPKR